MAISGVDPKCYILALFVRDDGTRFLLGDDPYEFKDKQLHFQPNTMANDVVEVQGNDGYLLAGQVRRPGTQSFDGYVGNGTNSKAEVEAKRRDFLQFFRRSHFYKVIYVFPNGTAIQRKQGFLVDDPTVQELYQQYPEYHVALNFEDVNYYTYEEDDQGHEIYAKEAIVPLARGGATGGLIWDSYGVVWEDAWSLPLSISGVQFQILNNAGARAPIDNVQLYGDTYQQTYSGANLFNVNAITPPTGVTINADGSITCVYDNTSGSSTRFMNLYTPNLDLQTSTTYAAFAEIISLSGGGTLAVITGGSSASQFTHNKTFDLAGYRSGDIIKTTDETKADFSGTNVGTRTYVSVQAGLSLSLTFRMSVIADTTVTPEDFVYQPYVGGIPAPNPDYPQDVQTVTGEQTVEVTGKNLIDSTNLSFVYSNSPTQIELSSISNGIRMVNNGGVSQDRFAVFRSVDMTPYIGKVVRMKATFGTGGGIRLYRIASDGSNRSQMATTTFSDTEISFTVPANLGASPYLGYVLDVTVGGGTTVDFTNLIATVDSSIEPYEPYQSQTYPISLTGKNLFNVSATPTYTNGVSVSGNLTVTATSSGTGKYALYRLVEAKNYVGSKVCVSCSVMHPSSTNDARIEIGLCNADGTSKTSKASTNNVNVKPSFTVTDDPSKPYIYVALYASYSSSASVGDYVGYGSVMVNRGSTPGAYVGYSPVELCKIGNYRDKIYNNDPNEDWYDPDLEDNAWYVHKAIGMITADGSYGGYNGTRNWFYVNPTSYGKPSAIKTVVPVSNYFTGYEYTPFRANSTVDGCSVDSSDSSPSLLIRNNTFSTATAYTTWLANTQPKLYYALAAPTDTKITDATLVGQLEALGAMKLFIGENNVLVSATNPNLPATLAFDYYTKFAAIGAEWEEGGTKGATIVNVDAIDNTYPVWELTGPATNPTLSVLTTNTALTYNGTITASQKLVIDMFNKTATLNGTSVIGNISGDFVYMAPGTNRVAYTAGNTDAPDSIIYWQEVVG